MLKDWTVITGIIYPGANFQNEKNVEFYSKVIAQVYRKITNEQWLCKTKAVKIVKITKLV